MKKLICVLFLAPMVYTAQNTAPSEVFWKKLETHCGKAYAGEITSGGVAGDGFTGKKLVMHVRSCEPNDIRIPFFVGDDKSRTWVLHKNENKTLRLKHDHRHADGSEEISTQYGGTNSNVGLENLQMFPADSYTAQLIPKAATNVWWFTIADDHFTYNLRRIGSDRQFTVRFDLTQPIATPGAPWDTKD